MTDQLNSLEGFYSLNFRGAASFGVGIVALHAGLVAGADIGGVLYDGTYNETDTNLVLDMELTVPPGASLAQGTAPRTLPYKVPFHVTIDKAAIETSRPVLVQMPPGPVNVIIKRLRGLAS